MKAVFVAAALAGMLVAAPAFAGKSEPAGGPPPATVAVPPSSAADTATLTVHVVNVSPKGGLVSLALFTAANYTDDNHPTLSRDVEAELPETTVVLHDLAPGEYAIKMMQDINRNGKFDTTWLGFPLEPYGFSNDAEPGLEEPSFRETRFHVFPGANAITIKLSDTDGIDVPKRSLRQVSERN